MKYTASLFPLALIYVTSCGPDPSQEVSVTVTYRGFESEAGKVLRLRFTDNSGQPLGFKGVFEIPDAGSVDVSGKVRLGDSPFRIQTFVDTNGNGTWDGDLVIPAPPTNEPAWDLRVSFGDNDLRSSKKNVTSFFADPRSIMPPELRTP